MFHFCKMIIKRWESPELHYISEGIMSGLSRFGFSLLIKLRVEEHTAIESKKTMLIN